MQNQIILIADTMGIILGRMKNLNFSRMNFTKKSIEIKIWQKQPIGPFIFQKKTIEKASICRRERMSAPPHSRWLFNSKLYAIFPLFYGIRDPYTLRIIPIFSLKRKMRYSTEKSLKNLPVFSLAYRSSKATGPNNESLFDFYYWYTS